MTSRALVATVLLAIWVLLGVAAHPGVTGTAVAKSPAPPSVAAAGSWTLLGTQPPARTDPGWVYDSRADRFIAFGGSPTYMNYTNITWAYDYTNNTWTNVTPTVGPSPRADVAMTYDPAADRVILFGGSPNPLYGLNDTWIFDYANRTWTNVSAAKSPGMRADASMVYDPVADKVVLFGGINYGNTMADTWIYDYRTNVWTSPTVSGAPTSRALASMVYDPVAHGPLLFGGIHSGILTWYNDLYSYDVATATWTHRTPPANPPARALAGMAYDVAAQRTILFGGLGGRTPGTVRNDTWAYGAAANLWANITPTASPSPRQQMGMAYDSRADRVVFYAGAFADNTSADEAWSYRFGAVLPLAPVNLTATAGRGNIALTWQSPTSDGGATITGYAVYRGTTSGGEILLPTSASGLTYRDTAVAAGTTYFYKVAAVTAAGTGLQSNEASATTPIPDTTPPAITISAPSNNTVLSAWNVTVVGTAADNVAVQEVEVSTDGTNWRPATGTTTWAANLTLPVGANKIYARATDTSGNVATAQISVTVQLPSTGALLGIPIEGWILAVALSIFVAALAVFLVVRRRRKPSHPQALPPPAPAPTSPAAPPSSPRQPPTGPPGNL